MTLIDNIRDWFASETARNKNSSLIAGLLISEENTSESGARVAKIWLLIAFVMGFASIIAAVWVMIDDFINNSEKDSAQGVALLMQNILILLANLTYKLGRNEDDWNE
ncbi:hypothetical protein GQX74_012941 [Glossina fuscipes]|nr:hypothetical protein GQX74_012941 [Glossina fuscipes]